MAVTPVSVTDTSIGRNSSPGIFKWKAHRALSLDYTLGNVNTHLITPFSCIDAKHSGIIWEICLSPEDSRLWKQGMIMKVGFKWLVLRKAMLVIHY
jgi:hypothetical protein